MNTPIMPKATAVWLVDNTSLTFGQIADFCGLYLIEVQAIADGQFSVGLQPANPIDNGQLTRKEIERCEKDPKAKLQLNIPYRIDIKTKKTKKYTPILKRQDRPRAVMWIMKHYPKMSDSAICSLLSTTKKLVQSIRDRSYPNLSELTAKDPVFLGFCTQTELNNAIGALKKDEEIDDES